MLSFNINIPGWLVYVFIFVSFLASIRIVSLNSRQRDAVLGNFRVKQRRTSGATTPPRDLSPETSFGSEKASMPSGSITQDYATVFPPSRRWVLPILAEFATSPKQQQALSGPDPSNEIVQTEQLARTQSYKSVGETAKAKYLPHGFSTAEIQALGDFPAYDILSGVRLPKPYEDFDPAKALPRPYRPFRWAYHQTMCKTLVRQLLTKPNLIYRHSSNQDGT